MTWLLVVGGILFVGFVIVVGFVASNPKARRTVEASWKSQAMAQAAQKAPGAAEVRAAGHCQIALVQDVQDTMALGQYVLDGGAAPTDSRFEGKLVMCMVGALQEPPTCDAIANTYVDAVHPTTKFFVSVGKIGGTVGCTQGYSSVGDHLPAKMK